MANFLERLVNADKRTLAKIEKKAEEVMALAGEAQPGRDDCEDQRIQGALQQWRVVRQPVAGSVRNGARSGAQGAQRVSV